MKGYGMVHRHLCNPGFEANFILLQKTNILPSVFMLLNQAGVRSAVLMIHWHLDTTPPIPVMA
jgi:hypothetical protein